VLQKLRARDSITELNFTNKNKDRRSPSRLLYKPLDIVSCFIRMRNVVLYFEVRT